MRVGVLLSLLALTPCCGLHALPDPLVTDPAELIANMDPGREYCEGEQTLFAVARIEYYGEGKARKAKVEIMAARPDRMRMNVLSFTDDLISVLTADGEGFTFFERGKPHCYNGPPCAAPIVSRVPMVSDPAALLVLLEGRVPMLQEPDEKKLQFSRKEGVYLLDLVKGDLSQRLRIAPDGRTLTGASMSGEGENLFNITFEGRKKAGKRTVPERLRLVSGNPEVDLSIEYREVEFGLEFHGDPFSFPCPVGTEVRYLTCEEDTGE